MAISLPIEGPLQPAEFLERPNRNTLRASLQLTTEKVEAHLSHPGALTELLQPGRRVWLRQGQTAEHRKQWTAVLCENPGGQGLVSLDLSMGKQLVHQAFLDEGLEEFEGWTLERTEAPLGKSRFDFLLGGWGENLVLEVRSANLALKGMGMFPDTPNERDVRLIRELIRIHQRPGWSAAVMFIAERIDVQKFAAAKHIDPDFGDAIKEARQHGVHIFARRCQLTLEEIVLGISIPVL